MTTSMQDKAAATDQLRRVLLAFQETQRLLLAAHRRLKGLPQAEVEQFWANEGRRLERHLHATATEVDTAFAAFSAAGLVADPADRHLVNQARRYLAEGR